MRVGLMSVTVYDNKNVLANCYTFCAQEHRFERTETFVQIFIESYYFVIFI